MVHNLTRGVCLVQVQGMMQAAYSYRNAFHAVASIVQQQGLPGLMKGYWATNSVWFPWNMIYIASYEKSKTMLAHNLQAGIFTLPNICRGASICQLIGTRYTCSWIHVLSLTCLKSSQSSNASSSLVHAGHASLAASCVVSWQDRMQGQSCTACIALSSFLLAPVPATSH